MGDGARASSARNEAARVGPLSRTVLETCRAALIKSSAAARTAKHRSSIDSRLAEMLELVGDYEEVEGFPYHFHSP